MDSDQYLHYEHFILQNEKRMNRFFNRILWICCFVGPLIAVGVFFNAFPEVTYHSCAITTVILFIFALCHTIICKYKPESRLTKYAGLYGLLLTVVSMCLNHIGIYLTYFFVPLSSLLYCRRHTFITMSISSYVAMIFCNWQISDFMAGVRTDIEPIPWFIGIIGGETIEFIVMLISGLFVNKVMVEHLETMYGSEITLQKKEISSYVDELSSLWNRRYLEKAYDKYIVVQKNMGVMLALDLDHFKDINDTYGHLEGDHAIVEFSNILKSVFTQEDTSIICRFGGDEFVILLPFVQDSSALSTRIHHLYTTFGEKFSTIETFRKVTISIGAAFIKKNDVEYSDVFARADNALYRVKNAGRNGFLIYNEAHHMQAD